MVIEPGDFFRKQWPPRLFVLVSGGSGTSWVLLLIVVPSVNLSGSSFITIGPVQWMV